jgi:hypothetical protein
MPRIVPSHAVRSLVDKGCQGDFSQAQPAFNEEESVALLRFAQRSLAARTPEAGDALVETIHAIIASSTARHRTPPPIHCARGCGHCCHQRVVVNAIEAFYIARRLRRTRAELAPRLAAALARPDPEPGRAFDAGRPCVFLVDDACSIHPLRPGICRIIVSLDVGACVRRLAAGSGDIPWPRAHEAIRDWLAVALWTAQRVTGLPTRGYELTAAVAVLLADPGLEARWYAGDDGLAAASGDGDIAHPTLEREIASWRALARL